MSVTNRHVPIIVVQPVVEETLRSYAIRACMENGWPSQSKFLKRSGLSRSLLTSGKALDSIASSLGLAPGAVASMAGSWSRSAVQFGQNQVSRSKIHGVVRQVCRHCLAAKPVAPFEWEFDFISDCPEHGPLSTACDCKTPLSWSNRHLSSCDACPAMLDLKAPDTAPEAVPSPFQHYVLGRFDRLPPTVNAVLDPLPVDVVVDLVRALGELLDMGYSPSRSPSPSAADRIRWAETGYAWLVGDDPGHLLSPIVSAFREAKVVAAPREPIRALGFVAETTAFQLDGAGGLEALVRSRLGHALGYPVSDLWRTDYRELSFCLATIRWDKEQFLSALHRQGWLSRCITSPAGFFVPVDTLWELTHRPSG